MAKHPSGVIVRVGQRLFGILVAITVAILAGLAAVFLLDAVLPHGKGLQMPTIFLGAFVSAGVAGVACMRTIGPKRITSLQSGSQAPHDPA